MEHDFDDFLDVFDVWNRMEYPDLIEGIFQL